MALSLAAAELGAVFTINERFMLLICRICRYAVSPLYISNHLKDKHKGDITPDVRVKIAAQSPPLIQAGLYTDLLSLINSFTLPLPAAIDGIDVNRDALKCLYCDYITRQAEFIRKHYGRYRHDIGFQPFDPNANPLVCYQ